MSRIGKQPVAVPNDVTVELQGREVSVNGPKGQLSLTLVDEVEVNVGKDEVTVRPRDESQRARSMWGMQRSLLQNLVTGVAQGFTKELRISGVGYRAAVQGKALELQLGYSHNITYPIPDGIDIKTPSPTVIQVSGIDRQRVGQVAAEIRRFRKPEPYKGKGIKYAGEYIFRKEGKKK